MVRHLLISMIMIFASLKPGFSEEIDKQNTLAAFSLSAAKKAYQSSDEGNKIEAKSVGFINRVWGVTLDEEGDLIIIGERDPSVETMSLDDIAVAIRTMDFLDGNESPGVSIEPVEPGEDASFQKVKYYGGINHTNYGRIVLQSDMLLKNLSTGFAATGIEGFPSEWDMSLHNAKTGNEFGYWEFDPGPSWFFPVQIGLNHRDKTAVVTSVKIAVGDSREEAVKIPDEYLSLNADELEKILDEDPASSTVIFARLLSQHYEEIAEQHPILTSLQNLLVVSALVKELIPTSQIRDLDYWKNEFPISHLDLPSVLPQVYRGVNGLVYSQRIEGGIGSRVRGCSDVLDGWSDLVCSRDPKFLREAVLSSRPSPESVSWIVPVELGSPKNWAADPILVKKTQASEDEKTSKMASPDLQGGLNRLLREISIQPKPTKTPGWHPSTEGNHVLEFSARFYLSSGGAETFSPDRRVSASANEVSLGIPINLRWAYRNRFSIELTLPFTFKMRWEDQPDPYLPGIGDTDFGYVGGMQNPVLTNQIQLISGINKGKWNLPSLVLVNSAEAPLSRKYTEKLPEEKPARRGVKIEEDGPPFVSLSDDEWHSSHGLEMMLPVDDFWIQGSGKFFKDWGKIGAEDRKQYSVGIGWRFDREEGLAVRLSHQSIYLKSEETSGTWVPEGRQLYLSFLTQTRTGLNSVSLGYITPLNQPNLGKTYLFLIDLDGLRLWNFRKWF